MHLERKRGGEGRGGGHSALRPGQTSTENPPPPPACQRTYKPARGSADGTEHIQHLHAVDGSSDSVRVRPDCTVRQTSHIQVSNIETELRRSISAQFNVAAMSCPHNFVLCYDVLVSVLFYDITHLCPMLRSPHLCSML